MQSKIIYCWDTSVLTAWVNEESTAPLGDIGLVVDELDNNKATLLMSVNTITEMLDAKFTPGQRTKYDLFFKRSNVVMANITPQIAQRASMIRNCALTKGRKIQTPDAQILATALLYKADVLHSLDIDHMLNLDGSEIVGGLKIIRPIPISGDKWLKGLN